MSIQVSEALAESARQGLAKAIFKAFQYLERPSWGRVNTVVIEMCRAVTAANQLGITKVVPLSKDEGKQLSKIIGPLVDLNMQEEIENLIFDTLTEKGMEPDIVERVKALKAKELAERHSRIHGTSTQSDKSGGSTVH